MESFQAYLLSIWGFIEAMAPYLLLGLTLAGVMHVFLPKDFIYRHLSQGGLGSIFKGSLLGVPMPLCSCSVIPVAQHVHKAGASKGATLSFVSSTPSTGVDSISALWGMMGPIYTGFKVVLAFLGGWITGLLVSWSEGELSSSTQVDTPSTKPTSSSTPASQNVGNLPKASLGFKLKMALSYAFNDLFKDFAKWLFFGTLIGASLELILPQDMGLVDNIWLSYLIVILVSMPLYVCATGSIPLALALLSQGFSPGAVLIFLTLGPVSNAATLSWLWGTFGAKVTSVYFGTLAVLAVGAASLMDLYFGEQVIAQSILHHHEESSLWVSLMAIVFSVIWAYHLIRILNQWVKSRWSQPRLDSPSHQNTITYQVEGMTCGNCVESVESFLKSQNIKAVVSLETHTIQVSPEDEEALIQAKMMLAMKGYQLTSTAQD